MGNGILIGSTGTGDNEKMMFQVQNGKEKAHDKKEDKKQGNSIYVGDLQQNQNPISEKFAQAQKRAIKKLVDQLEEDLKIDGEMEESSNHIEELQESVCDTYQQIKEIDAHRSELMERYEIDPDSQEQKDLELMQKVNAIRQDPFNEDLKLTEEEQKRLAEMPPLTDYQKEMLECDKLEEKYCDTISDNRKDIKIESATIEATKKALLKVHPMVDAQKEAEGIMESALKEMVGSLLQEGVDKIDEDMKESQEELEEAQEQALEEKIRREKLKAEEAEREEAAQELQEMVSSVTMQTLAGNQQAIQNLQSNIKSLIQDQILLDVDMKGLRVDEQI